MTDYARFGDLVGQTIEEPQLLAYCPRGGACYGCASCVGGDASYMYGSMPGSPASDCSASTVSMEECLSPPTSPSPFHSEDSCSSDSYYASSSLSSSSSSSATWRRHARPVKSALRRVGGGAARKRCVTWDPDTVFETRPLMSKRRRAALAAEELAAQTEETTQTDSLSTKRAKFAEPAEHQATATFRPHIAPSKPNMQTTSLCPELERNMVPCFDFSSCLAITLSKPSTTLSALPNNSLTSSPSSTPSTPISFSIAKPKTIAVSSLLGASSRV